MANIKTRVSTKTWSKDEAKTHKTLKTSEAFKWCLKNFQNVRILKLLSYISRKPKVKGLSETKLWVGFSNAVNPNKINWALKDSKRMVVGETLSASSASLRKTRTLHNQKSFVGLKMFLRKEAGCKKSCKHKPFLMKRTEQSLRGKSQSLQRSTPRLGLSFPFLSEETERIIKSF